ncbi:MAG: hypothetical protein O7I93_11355, partial [Gemmatimonadetes bacterium]|nr:hypothetical protein [Gemmatimonadota bacterium]
MSWLILAGVGAGLVVPSAAVGQVQGPGVRLRFPVDTLQIQSPSALRLGGLWDGTVSSRMLVEQWVARTLRAVEQARLARRRRWVLDALAPPPPPDTATVIQPIQIPVVQDTAPPGRPTFATLAQ